MAMSYSEHSITTYYVMGAYSVFLVACAFGAFSKSYNANLAQRVALAIFAVWAGWRMDLVSRTGWGYPHESTVASAMLLYALGSAWKTVSYALKNRRRDRRSCDHHHFAETEVIER